MTANNRLAPERYKRRLLDRFERGEITLDHMEALLEARVHMVLYHSHAAESYAESELQALLDWSRPFNAAHGVTGLLLYSAGRFV